MGSSKAFLESSQWCKGCWRWSVSQGQCLQASDLSSRRMSDVTFLLGFEAESSLELWLGDWRSCPAVDVRPWLPFLLLEKSLQWSSRHVLLLLIVSIFFAHSRIVTMNPSLIIRPQLEPIKMDSVQRFLNLSLNSVAGWVFCYWGWGACLWWHTGELTDIEQNYVSERVCARASMLTHTPYVTAHSARNLSRVSSFLPCRSLGLNLGCQVWKQCHYPFE